MTTDNSCPVYAPSYYKKFKCLASDCNHSCCIGWEIMIDEKTLKRYREIPEIKKTLKECPEGSCFALTRQGRCPHLNQKGLCEIIISKGEDYLSDICKSHPRFFNYTASRIEVGIGLSCPEACRLILESEEPFILSPIEEIPDIGDYSGAAEVDGDKLDLIHERDAIICHINSFGGGFSELAAMLRSEYSLPTLRSMEEWLKLLLSLEILDTGWRRILKSALKRRPAPSPEGKLDKYLIRLLTYFIYRHVSIAESPTGLRARLSFSLLSAEIINHLAEAEGARDKESLAELSRLYSLEIEYCEENTDSLIFEFEGELL